MSKSYATILHSLCQDYMNHKLSFEEYRRRRRQLLQKIDAQFNNVDEPQTDEELTAPLAPSQGASITAFNFPFKKRHQ